MDNLPSAEQCLRNAKIWDSIPTFKDALDLTECMKQFAKMHVEAALKKASEEVKLEIGFGIKLQKRIVEMAFDERGEPVMINKESILTAYGPENIK